MPLIETIIIARPTQNSSLYTQMVGRGLRLHPDKSKLKLIDLVGVTGKANLCTAPSLIGLDMTTVSTSKQEQVQGDLFELPELIIKASDTPESWIRNIEFVNLWAKEQEYNTHGVNWFKMPNGDMVVHLKGSKLILKAQNELGETELSGAKMKMQHALDLAYKYLQNERADEKYLWDLKAVKSWGKSDATLKQKQLISTFRIDVDFENLSKLEASQILNRLFYK